MKNKDFQYYLSAFFTDYLPKHKGASSNTISSYRDCFALFLEYCDKATDINIDELSFQNINTSLILNFLCWLENSRKVSPQTRNNRLAAIKSFCKFVELEAPEFYEKCSLIRKIEPKKCEKKSINYLSVEAVKILMEQPDTRTKQGLRDLALIALMYDSAARVQELATLTVSKIILNNTNIVYLTGKGNKTRIVPISKEVAGILKRYINTYELKNDDLLFFNKSHKQLTKEGISYILDKYISKSKEKYFEIFNKKITPHCIRHSKAMHILEANVNLIYIRDFLGHVSVKTTEIYCTANPETRRKQIETASNGIIKNTKYSAEEKSSLQNFLKELI
ncbi:MAG: tyrosine-type recombinase/integrase [Clostridia bacterium]